jgi:DNA N-6-adenine-methyltransferase (Dam)
VQAGQRCGAVAAYLGSMDFGNLAYATRCDRRRILERFREDHGERNFAGLARKHVEIMLSEMNATRAGVYYDKHINGLEQPWFGKVWLNPPYSRVLMAKFAGRLLHQYEKGNVEAGIMLVHNCTETSWFQISGAGATRVCFPKGRIGFYNPSRTTKSTPGIGQALLYYGTDAIRFEKVFGAIGIVMGRAGLMP